MTDWVPHYIIFVNKKTYLEHGLLMRDFYQLLWLLNSDWDLHLGGINPYDVEGIFLHSNVDHKSDRSPQCHLDFLGLRFREYHHHLNNKTFLIIDNDFIQ